MVGHPLVFPGMVRLGGSRTYRYSFQIRVPMDDEQTWHLEYDCYDPGPEVRVPAQETLPSTRRRSEMKKVTFASITFCRRTS